MGFGQFPVDEISAGSPPAVSHRPDGTFTPDPPQYGTLMKRLDETYNFPNILHFEICKIKLLEVKNYFQAPQTVSAHAIVATAEYGLGEPPPLAAATRRLY